MAAAALLTLLVFCLKLGLLHGSLNAFGVLHLIYLDLVFIPPLIGAAVLLSRRAKTAAVRFIAWSSWVTIPLAIYCSYIEPFRLQLETPEVTVAPDRQGRAPIRIGVLADIQTAEVGPYERQAVDRLLEQRPDIIVIPGDLFHWTHLTPQQQQGPLRRLLGRLAAPGGVYFVMGDTDRRQWIEPILAGTDVRLLPNEMVRVRLLDRQITIGGIELDYQSRAARQLIDRLENDHPSDDDLRLLVTHRPDVIEHLQRDSRIDLVIAGHTHGGQVVVPFLGPPITSSHLPRHVAAGGLHQLHGRRIYISRSVGHEQGQAPRIRFLCPPEITVLTITTAP